MSGTATWNAGRINNAFQFDGTTSINVAGLAGRPRNATLTAWAKLTAADTSGSEVISLGNSFAIRLDAGGNAQALFYNGTGWITVPYNQMYAGAGWHRFAAVFDELVQHRWGRRSDRQVAAVARAGEIALVRADERPCNDTADVVIVDELAPGRCPALVDGGDPAGGLEQSARGGLDEVPPGREQPRVPPEADRCGDLAAGLEHREADALLHEVGRRGQSDRTSADDGHRQRRQPVARGGTRGEVEQGHEGRSVRYR